MQLASREAQNLPRGFFWLISAQFASGLADNALLIVAMAFLQEQGYPVWWAPLLKFAFTWSYVLLAPVVGDLADRMSKNVWMGWMNALKLLATATLLLHWHPLLVFAVVGFGAACYAPAKYGLVTEAVPHHLLVKANGWLEVSVVLSVLLGAGLGGWLVSGWWDVHHLGPLQPWLVPTRLAGSVAVVLGLYAVAAALNMGLPRLAPVLRRSHWHPVTLVKAFAQANRRLWRDGLGGLSLAVTTVFWGAGAVLQFGIFRWAEQVLHLPLSQAAYLQAAVAVGVVLGATLAAHRVPLERSPRMLPWGVVLGVLVTCTTQVTTVAWALPLLVLTGMAGGLLVVPMNALLQHRGFALLRSGQSIAVQGFNEHLSVLVMLGVYAGLLAWPVPIVGLLAGFGVLLALGMLVLWVVYRRHSEVLSPAPPPPRRHA